MNAQTLVCIGCPLGCELTVAGSLEDMQVSGQACKIGEKYGREEAFNPTRNIATSVRVADGVLPMLSVKTSHPIPKAQIMDCVRALKAVQPQAPVRLGDVILADVAGTGVDIVATRHVPANSEPGFSGGLGRRGAKAGPTADRNVTP